jgi:hypothetical protein
MPVLHIRYPNVFARCFCNTAGWMELTVAVRAACKDGDDPLPIIRLPEARSRTVESGDDRDIRDLGHK